MSNEPLSEVMRIRLTSGQHRRLSEAAALSGLNLSDYVRRRLTAADTLAEELDALRQAVRHLSQISETHAAALETALLVRATARPEQIAIAQAANSTGKLGLVGYWDVVAFDEFAGKQKRVDKALVDIMKNYMANKSFSRSVETLGAEASMVFVGNKCFAAAV